MAEEEKKKTPGAKGGHSGYRSINLIERGEVELLVGERMDGETDLAASACNDYLRMGRGRALSKLAKHYKTLVKTAKEKGLPAADVPTESEATLGHWSNRFDWVRRANGYDALQEEKRNLLADRIMEEGYAQTHQRVFMLDELIRKVSDFVEGEGLTRKIPKGVGWGEDFQIVYEEEFRHREIKELRGLLDDIAKEVGGRQKNVNMNLGGLSGLLTDSKAFERDEDIEDAEFEVLEEEDE